jgi:hypothetical protein
LANECSPELPHTDRENTPVVLLALGATICSALRTLAISESLVTGHTAGLTTRLKVESWSTRETLALVVAVEAARAVFAALGALLQLRVVVSALFAPSTAQIY